MGATTSDDDDTNTSSSLILGTPSSEPGLSHVRQCLSLTRLAVSPHLAQISAAARVTSYCDQGVLLLNTTSSPAPQSLSTTLYSLLQIDFSPKFPVEIEAGLKGSVMFHQYGSVSEATTGKFSSQQQESLRHPPGNVAAPVLGQTEGLPGVSSPV